MTRRPARPRASDALLADVLGTPCPHENCTAWDHPEEPCTDEHHTDPHTPPRILRVPHVKRITAATQDQP